MDSNVIYADGTYLDKNPSWHEEDSPWKAKQISRMLKKNDIRPSRICEIGCGAGEILNCLAADSAADVAYFGYEISPQAFDICKKKERNNLHFFHKDLLAEEGLAFDVVAAMDVFEHVEDCFGFLRKLQKKGQYKIFHIPLDLSVQSVLRCSPILDARSLVGHIHYFTKETALATLVDCGYEIIDSFYTDSSLALPNLGWKANMLKLPRRLCFSVHQDLAVRILGGYSLLVLAR